MCPLMKFEKVQEEIIKTSVSKQGTVVNLNNTGYWLYTNPLYLAIAVQLELSRNKTYKSRLLHRVSIGFFNLYRTVPVACQSHKPIA
jgi:hypothetical protein